MTRKHFKALAEAIREIDNGIERTRTALLIAQVCQKFNDGFDYDKFYEACNAQFDKALNA